MKYLKILYLWIFVLALLDLYGRLIPSGTAPEAVTGRDSVTGGNELTGPARASRGP